MPRKKWTKEDIAYFERNISTSSFKDLAVHFGVSVCSIACKASKLGISRKKATGELWSSKEDAVVKKHFEYAPKDFLMERLPGRTWVAIFQRGSKTFKLSRKTQDKISLNYNALSDWNEFSAYVVGFVLADGHIINKPEDNEKILQIELASHDEDILEQIAIGLDYKGNIGHTKRNTSKFQTRNKKIVDDLISKGVPFHDKTFEAQFPDTLPSSLLKHFIRGVFDGDGSVYLDQKTLAFQLLGTKPLLATIKDKCAVFFKNSSIYDRSRGKNGSNVHCLKVKGKKAVRLLGWLYQDATIYLHRKRDIYDQYINSPSYGKPCEDRA